MIYADRAAVDDLESEPVDRDEPCLNCGGQWWEHNGWICNNSGFIRTDCRFSNVPPAYRYLTRGMLDTAGTGHGRNLYLTPNEVIFIACKRAAAAAVDIIARPPRINDRPDWFLSREAGLQPGECPCGIAKQRCAYHKDLHVE